MDTAVSLSTLGQILGAAASLVAIIWTFRGMLSGLEKTLTGQNASLNTKIELLQQAQTNAATNLEYRFSNISGTLEQGREHMSRLQVACDDNAREIVKLKARSE